MKRITTIGALLLLAWACLGQLNPTQGTKQFINTGTGSGFTFHNTALDGQVTGNVAAVTNAPFPGWQAIGQRTPPLYCSPFARWTDAMNATEFMWEANQLAAWRSNGWNIIQWDDGWQARDGSGNLTWNTSHATSPIWQVVQWVHALNLRFMGYISMSTNGGCLGYGSSSLETCYADARTMVSWGFDGVKLDICGNQYTPRQYAQYMRVMNQGVSDAFANLGSVDARYASAPYWLVHYPSALNSLDALEDPEIMSYAQMIEVMWWGTLDPTGVQPSDPKSSDGLWLAAHAVNRFNAQVGPGHFLGPANLWFQPHSSPGGAALNGWDVNPYVTNLINICVMTCSPIQLDSALAAGTNAPAIMSNSEIWRMHQDEAVIPATIIWTNGSSTTPAEVWSRPLGGTATGRRAVMLVNSNTVPVSITVNSGMFGDPAGTVYTVRDPWGHQNIGTFTDTFSFTVQPTNWFMVKVKATPPDESQYVGMFTGTHSGNGAGLTNLSDASLQASNQLQLTVVPYTRETMQRTPLMGIDPWYGPYNATFDDSYITNQIVIATTNGWTSKGYRVFEVTDNWQNSTRVNGHLVPNPARLINLTNDIAYAHSKGWLIRIYTEPGPTTSAGNPGSDDAHFEQDIQDFISWGVDIIRLDMPGISDFDTRMYWLRRLKSDINKYSVYTAQQAETNFVSCRSVLIMTSSGWRPGYTVSPFDMGTLLSVADIVQVVQDSVADTPITAWTNFLTRFHETAQFTWAVGSGKWMRNDYTQKPNIDGTWGQMGNSIFGMNAMLNGEINFNAMDPPGDGSSSASIIGNSDIIGIDQDPLGIPAHWVKTTNNIELWVKPMSGGMVAAGLLNLTTNMAGNITVDWKDLGLDPSAGVVVRDAVYNATVGVLANSFSTNVPAMQAGIYIFKPLRNVEYVHANAWNVNSPLSALSVDTYSPSPYFFSEGKSGSGGSDLFIKIGIPDWVTNVAGMFYVQCNTATQAWTNTFNAHWYEYGVGRYDSQNSLLSGVAPTVAIIGTNGLNVVVIPNIPLLNKNCPKDIQIQVGTSTNATTRYIIGPMQLIYN